MNLITVYAIGTNEKIDLTPKQAKCLDLYQRAKKLVDEVGSTLYFAQVLEEHYQNLRSACIRSRSNKLPAQFAVDVFHGKRWQN